MSVNLIYFILIYLFIYFIQDRSENHFKRFEKRLLLLLLFNINVVVQFFVCGLKCFKPVWFLFPFVSDYGSEYCTKENEIKLVWKILNKNLNHNN